MHFIATTIFLAVGLVQALPKPQNNMLPGGNVIPTAKVCNTYYTEHDHPDPHQLYEFTQLTDTLACDTNTGCEISRSETEGKTVSASASLTGISWISGGFEVGEYSEKTQVFTCQGSEGDEICVFWRQAYTMYGVRAHYLDKQCHADGEADTTITSPNKDPSKASQPVCAKGKQCGAKGMKYWNNMEGANGGSTYASGPTGWPFGDDKGLKDIS